MLLRKSCILAVVWFLIAAGYSLSQEHSDYHLFGTVKDSKGRPLAEAKIHLKNVENGRLIQIKVKEDGTYDQQFIPHGIYSVTIEKEGYLPRQIERLDLSAVGSKTIQRQIEVVLITPQEEAEIKLQQERARMTKQVQGEYKKGVDLFTAKKYDEAIEVMQKVAEMSPESYGPFLVMGASYHAKGDLDKAILNYEKTIAIKSDLADAHRYLAEIYTLKKDYSKAVVSYRKLLELQPEDVESRCILGNILFALDKVEEAEAEIQKGLVSNPNVAVCHKAIAEVQVKKGDTKAALAGFKKYLELQPNAPDKKQVTEMIQLLEQVK